MSDNLRPIVKCSPEGIRGKFEKEARNTFRALRRAAGLSQSALATRIECDQASVENWEAGRSRVPGWALLAVELIALAPTGTGP
jgi:DNA-binding transcriptional regulator YiaG